MLQLLLIWVLSLNRLARLVDLKEALTCLQQGKLVAFPTETVYGLGADASNQDAVAKLYLAKGRPPDHPIIVHVASPKKESIDLETDWLEILSPWWRDIPDLALRLIFAFWPGPLTLVLEKSKTALDALTGGQKTLALRAPSHPLAQELLRAFGGGIAGPSANRFGRVSPTSAMDVLNEFPNQDGIAVLDGGNCAFGIESTIIDLSDSSAIRLLRPGSITPEMIKKKTGIDVRKAVEGEILTRVSGSLKAHYAPHTPLALYAEHTLPDLLKTNSLKKIALLIWNQPPLIELQNKHHTFIQIPMDSNGFARNLYRYLRDLDHGQYDLILMPETPSGQNWDGVRDRLQRAAFGSGAASD